MTHWQEHSVEVTINNRMGFHVRPVQRFAELARAFKSEVEVEMKDRKVPGTSIINLMSLGGRCGDTMRITARGEDARQCVEVLRILAEDRFFVEDNMDVAERPLRHVERLADMASCFRSDIRATLDGKSGNAKEFQSLQSLGLEPTSEPQFEIEGEDAEQARAVIDNLVRCCFYVEDEMVLRGPKAR